MYIERNTNIAILQISSGVNKKIPRPIQRPRLLNITTVGQV
jgi:hypothetical protein